MFSNSSFEVQSARAPKDFLALAWTPPKKCTYNFEKLPNDWLIKSESELKQRIICDYISGMTDRYASNIYKSIYE